MGLEQIRVELLRTWGGDENIAHAAWASSYDKEKLNVKTDEDVRKVVTGIVMNSHGTPKETVWMEFFITCPIYCERQFDKYRHTYQMQDFQIEYLDRPIGSTITQNELSGRYRTIPERIYGMPTDVNNIVLKVVPRGGDWYDWSADWEDLCNKQHEEYNIRLDILKHAEKAGKITNAEYKRVREVWRGLLGTATLTDMRIMMNLHAFEHIINQRLAPESQTESRVIAYHMLKTLKTARVATVAIQNMLKVNNWEPWYQHVDALLISAKESRGADVEPATDDEDDIEQTYNSWL